MGGLPPLYDLVAYGFRAYTAVAADVHVLGAEHLRMRPRMLVVCAHRSDLDVPVICRELYFRHRNWARRDLLPHFAVRDDLFLRGFFAGYPPWRSARMRRLLWPVDAGRRLGRIRCHPIRSARRMRLVEVLAARPDVPAGELVPEDARAVLAARGVDLSRPAREALRAELADVLWRSYGDDELRGPALDEIWSERRRAALADFRRLLEPLRRGGTLMLFPEGRPSPDGAFGPLYPGVGALVRRARPDLLLPVSLAYDPLVRGRTRVHLSIRPPVRPPGRDIEQAVLALLRLATPLTAGQLVARSVLGGAEPDPAGEVEAALEEGRAVEAALRDPSRRQARMAEALAAPRRDDVLRRLAREYESAREPAAAGARA
jgi:1-acyl-sn-glycerol-3-phosphate acyltransferase